MRKTLIASVVLASIVLAAAPVQAAGVVMPGTARFKGHDLVEWQRLYAAWVLGTADSPVVAGGCGEVVQGVFFLAPAAVPGTTEVDCAIPPGTPILALVGFTFSEIPTWGADDAAVLADARATWSGVIDNTLWVDGVEQVTDPLEREAGVYEFPIEEGSVYDVICESLDPPCTIDFESPGPVRLASIGVFALIRPLPPGTHEIVATTRIPSLELTIDATVTVG
jgi:hypothetical protein